MAYDKIHKIEIEHKNLDAAILLLMDGTTSRLRQMAADVMQKYPSLNSFYAGMGVCAFYRKNGSWFEDERLPPMAKAVIAYGNDCLKLFGSPEIEIFREASEKGKKQ